MSNFRQGIAVLASALGLILAGSEPALARKLPTDGAANQRGYIDFSTSLSLVATADATGFSQSLSADYSALRHLNLGAGADYLLDSNGALTSGGFWLGAVTPWWTKGRRLPYLSVSPGLSLGMDAVQLDNLKSFYMGTFLERPSFANGEVCLYAQPFLSADLYFGGASSLFASLGTLLSFPLRNPTNEGTGAVLATFTYMAGIDVGLFGKRGMGSMGFNLGVRGHEHLSGQALDVFSLFAGIGLSLREPNIDIYLGGSVSMQQTKETGTVGVTTLQLTWTYDTLCPQYDRRCDPDQVESPKEEEDQDLE
jgi:hypothetical protein